MNVSQSLVVAAVSGILLGCGGSQASGGKPATPNDMTGSSTPDPPGDKQACKGRNACKSQGNCKTDAHACKGQNECKGQGGCFQGK